MVIQYNRIDALVYSYIAELANKIKVLTLLPFYYNKQICYYILQNINIWYEYQMNSFWSYKLMQWFTPSHNILVWKIFCFWMVNRLSLFIFCVNYFNDRTLYWCEMENIYKQTKNLKVFFEDVIFGTMVWSLLLCIIYK